jgi:HEAT repeat protein
MVLGLVAAGALMALLWWLAVWSGEPRYKGRTLTHWLAVYHKAQLNSPGEREAAAAIRSMGTNALPYLVARLTYRTPAWRLRMVSLVEHLPGPADDWLITLILGDEDHIAAADAGFSLLGPQAAPAVPQLIRLLEHKETWDMGIVGLQDIGAGGIPELTAALTNRANSPRVRAGLVQVLGSVGTNSTVVPTLVACLADDPHVAAQAVFALGRLHLEPEVTVPALLNAAQNNANVRHQAIWALGEFNTNALTAVPFLTNCLADPDLGIRIVTTNALEAIAPEVLGPNAVAAEKQE